MKDDAYFKQYLAAWDLIYNHSDDDLIYVKDARFKFQAATKNMLKLMNLDCVNEIRNKTLDMVVARLGIYDEKFLEKINNQDIYVSNSKHSGIYLELVPDHKKFKLFLIKKSPIINPYNKNVVGIFGRLNNFVWPNVLKTLFELKGVKGLLLNGKSYEDPLQEYPINNMQHIVLFLCINNYSYTEIALFMNECGYPITAVRVNDYLEQLKLIFHVRTKSQLVEKAIGLNFHTLLPYGLFNNLNSISVSKDFAGIVCCDCILNICAVHNKKVNINCKLKQPKFLHHIKAHKTNINMLH